jgi:colanic acid/amylovoran biosynthesis glycosyltransferase
MTPTGGALTVGYLVSRYPATSHTFIRREIAALRARGVDVRACSVRRVAPDALDGEDRTELGTTEALVPPKLRDALGAVAIVLRHPWVVFLTTVRAVRSAPPGVRAHTYRMLHIVESVVFWSWCRRNDVVHVHAHFANVAADVARRTTDMRRAVGEQATWSLTMHGPTEFADTGAHALADKLRSADAIACISSYCRSQVLSLVPREHWHRVHLVRCGLDGDMHETGHVDTAANERDRHTARIICVGRLVPEKAHHLLLDAIEGLPHTTTHLDVVLVGGGPLEAEIRDRAAAVMARRPDVHVTCTGAIGNGATLALVRSSDVLVSSSAAEGLPVVLMEAMSLGTPVVATRIAGVPELVLDGVTGLVVDPGDAVALTEALDEVLTMDPVARSAMTEAARRRVSRRHDIRVAAILLESMFRTAVRDRCLETA